MGYSLTQKGYKVLNLKTQKILVSRDVVFYEKHLPFHSFSSTTTLSHNPSIFLPLSTPITPFLDNDLPDIFHSSHFPSTVSPNDPLSLLHLHTFLLLLLHPHCLLPPLLPYMIYPLLSHLLLSEGPPDHIFLLNNTKILYVLLSVLLLLIIVALLLLILSLLHTMLSCPHLANILNLNPILKLPMILIGFKLCTKSYKLWRLTIHGNLLIFLKERSSLDANGLQGQA